MFVATTFLGCLNPLPPGEFGMARLFGTVRGSTPLHLQPPRTDRNGNVYVLFGNPVIAEAQVFIGRTRGGWFNKCMLTRGDEFGVRGWVGFTATDGWYWSGDGLFHVSAQTGKCEEVLDRDPRSQTQLFFRAIVPWVRDNPTRTVAVALVQSVGDALPYQVVLDLQNDVYTDATLFSPSDASNVTVLGVGAERGIGNGFLVVRYVQNGITKVEGRKLNNRAETVWTVPLQGGTTLRSYGIPGFLQVDKNGLVAGLDIDGNLLTFNSAGGGFQSITGLGFTPVGVHLWEGKLWVAGYNAEGPVVAPLASDGVLGAATPWTASIKAAESLQGPIRVEDDRFVPRTPTTWDAPTNGVGPYPFLHFQTLDPYAEDQTGWLIAGPSFDFGGDRITSVAFAPFGVSYP